MPSAVSTERSHELGAKAERDIFLGPQLDSNPIAVRPCTSILGLSSSTMAGKPDRLRLTCMAWQPPVIRATARMFGQSGHATIGILQAMKVQDYIREAHKTDWLPSDSLKQDINPRLGLAGEIGSLLTVLKKEMRDNRPTAAATRAAIKDELGDIIWYSATVAGRASLDFQHDILYSNLLRIQSHAMDLTVAPAPLQRAVLATGEKLDKILRRGYEAIDSFGVYQELAFSTSRYKKRDALVPHLARIWQNAGQLLAPFGSLGHLDASAINDEEAVSKALGDIMWYAASFASVYDLNLDDVALANVSKIQSAFPADDHKIPTPLYDEGMPELEQFPRKFNVDFVETDDTTAVMLINGVRVGDRLTDNAYIVDGDDRKLIDGYRFHDSIHLAFAAVLGWSPVIRKLMMRKRKSDPEIDEVEDGARAQIVEEMIVKIAHSHAVGYHRDKLLDENKHVNLNLLKDIVILAEGLEVAGGRKNAPSCKYWEWEKAILEGFKVYNLLRRHRRGRIIVDLGRRTVVFSKLARGKEMRI